MSADNKYNLNGLYRIFSNTGNETLSISVYNAIGSLVIFRKNSENRRPLVKMNISGTPKIRLVDLLKSLLDAQPDTRMPFIQMAFNKETRAYEQQTAFVFFKDEKRCYGVEISNKSITTPIKFMFKCPNTFTASNTPMTDEEKSVLGVRELIEVLNMLPEACLLSRLNMESMTGPRKTGNMGGPRNNASGGSRDPYAAPPSVGGSDDIFG